MAMSLQTPYPRPHFGLISIAYAQNCYIWNTNSLKRKASRCICLSAEYSFTIYSGKYLGFKIHLGHPISENLNIITPLILKEENHPDILLFTSLHKWARVWLQLLIHILQNLNRTVWNSTSLILNEKSHPVILLLSACKSEQEYACNC